jgi:hypothetical protein
LTGFTKVSDFSESVRVYFAGTQAGMDSDLQFLSFWRIFPDQQQTDLFVPKLCPQKSACFRLFWAKLSISITAQGCFYEYDQPQRNYFASDRGFQPEDAGGFAAI